MRELLVIVFLLCLLAQALAQWTRDSPKFLEVMNSSKKLLAEDISSLPDVNLLLHPDRIFLPFRDYYFEYVDKENYKIGMILDPCRYNVHDCCMNSFGVGEYAALIDSGVEAERVIQKRVLGDDRTLAANSITVLEDSSLVASYNKRRSSDESFINPKCQSNGYEFGGIKNPSCLGYRYGQRVSITSVPDCADHNSSIDSTKDCLNPQDGSSSPHCVAIAYSQSAFAALCGGDYTNSNDCGTFIEIHQSHGTPYTDENDIIAETKILTRNVSGYYSTTISLNWMGDVNRVLCSYFEKKIRVGSIVYVLPSLDECCCPPLFNTITAKGSFMCPKGVDGGDGPFAGFPSTISQKVVLDSSLEIFPYCRTSLDDPDMIMWADFDANSRMAYTRRVQPIRNVSNFYTSDDLDSKYSAVCPWFEGCGLADKTVGCKTDSKFSFVGRVGLVVAIDVKPLVPLALVTFNNKRTVYSIPIDRLKIEIGSGYELWWVQRTRVRRIVQYKKSFNVTYPKCTFDVVNDRYFPYAKLDSNGDPIG